MCLQRDLLSKDFRKENMRTGNNKVLRLGVVSGRVWGSTDNLRKQLAIAAGTKPSVWLYLFLVVITSLRSTPEQNDMNWSDSNYIATVAKRKVRKTHIIPLQGVQRGKKQNARSREIM